MVVSAEVGKFLQPKTVSPKVFKFLRNYSENLSASESLVILTFNEYPFNIFTFMDKNGCSRSGEKLPTHVIIPCIRFVYDRRFHLLGSLFFYSDYMEKNRAKFSKDMSECIKLYILALQNVHLRVVATVSPYTEVFSDAIRILSKIPYMDEHFGPIWYDVGNIANIVHIHDPTHAGESMRTLLMKNDLSFSYHSIDYRASESDIVNTIRLNQGPLASGDSEEDFFPEDELQYGFSYDLGICLERFCEIGLLPMEAVGTSVFVRLCRLLFIDFYTNSEKAKSLIMDQKTLNSLIDFVASINIIERKESSVTSDSRTVKKKKSKTVRNLKDIDSYINNKKSVEVEHDESVVPKDNSNQVEHNSHSVGRKRNKKKKKPQTPHEVEKTFIKARVNVAAPNLRDHKKKEEKNQTIGSPISKVKDSTNSNQISQMADNDIKVNSINRKNKKKNKKTKNQPNIIKFESEETSKILTSGEKRSEISENKTITSTSTMQKDHKNVTLNDDESRLDNYDVAPASSTVDSKKDDEIKGRSEIGKAQIQTIQSKNSNISQQSQVNSASIENKKEPHKGFEQEYILKYTENDESTNNGKSRNKKRKYIDSESLNMNHNSKKQDNFKEKAPSHDAICKKESSERFEENENFNKKNSCTDNTIDPSRATRKYPENAGRNICLMNELNSVELLKENKINFETDTNSTKSSENSIRNVESPMQPQEIDITETKRSRTPVDLEVSEVLIMLSGQAMTTNIPTMSEEMNSMKASAEKTNPDILANEEKVESQSSITNTVQDNEDDHKLSPKVKEGESIISLKDLKSALAEIRFRHEIEATKEKLSHWEDEIKTTCKNNIENFEMKKCSDEDIPCPEQYIGSSKIQPEARGSSKFDTDRDDGKSNELSELGDNLESNVSNIDEGESKTDRNIDNLNEIPDPYESSNDIILESIKIESTKANESKGDAETEKTPGLKCSERTLSAAMETRDDGIQDQSRTINDDRVSTSESTVPDIKLMVEHEADLSNNETNEIPDLINESDSTVSDIELTSKTSANIDYNETDKIPELVEDSDSNTSQMDERGSGTEIHNRHKDFVPLLIDEKSTVDDTEETVSFGPTKCNKIKHMPPDMFYDEANLFLYEEIIENEYDEVFNNIENDDNYPLINPYFNSNENISEKNDLSSIESKHMKGESSINREAIEDTQWQTPINKAEKPKKILSPIETSDNISPSVSRKEIKQHFDRLKTPVYDDGSDKENVGGREEIPGIIPILNDFAEKFVNDQLNIEDINHFTQAITSASENIQNDGKSSMNDDNIGLGQIDTISGDSNELLVRNYLTPEQYEQILGSVAKADTLSEFGSIGAPLKDGAAKNSQEFQSSNTKKKTDCCVKEGPREPEAGLIKISWKDENTVGFEKVKADSIKLPTKDPFKMTDLRDIEITSIVKRPGEDRNQEDGSDSFTKTESMNDNVKGFIDSFASMANSGLKNLTPKEKHETSNETKKKGASKKTPKIRNLTNDIDDLRTWINFKQFVNKVASFVRRMSKKVIIPHMEDQLLEKIEESSIEFFITRRIKNEEDDAGKAYGILIYTLLGKSCYQVPEIEDDIGSLIAELDSLALADRQVDEFGDNAMKPEEKIARNLWAHNTKGMSWLFMQLRHYNYDELAPDLFKTEHVFDVMRYIMDRGNDPSSFPVNDDCSPINIKECLDTLRPQGSVLLVE